MRFLVYRSNAIGFVTPLTFCLKGVVSGDCFLILFNQRSNLKRKIIILDVINKFIVNICTVHAFNLIVLLDIMGEDILGTSQWFDF